MKSHMLMKWGKILKGKNGKLKLIFKDKKNHMEENLLYMLCTSIFN